MKPRPIRAGGAGMLALCIMLAGNAAAQEACEQMPESPTHHVLPAN
jgi:hypothetical protein